MGIIEIWYRKIFLYTKTANPEAYLKVEAHEDDLNDPLHLVDLYSIFLLWALGLLVAFVAFLIETIWKLSLRFLQRKNNAKSNKKVSS